MKVKYSIYEIWKYDIEIDTDDIDLSNYHKGSNIESVARTQAYLKKAQQLIRDGTIIMSRCFREDEPEETVVIHKKL